MHAGPLKLILILNSVYSLYFLLCFFCLLLLFVIWIPWVWHKEWSRMIKIWLTLQAYSNKVLKIPWSPWWTLKQWTFPWARCPLTPPSESHDTTPGQTKDHLPYVTRPQSFTRDRTTIQVSVDIRTISPGTCSSPLESSWNRSQGHLEPGTCQQPPCSQTPWLRLHQGICQDLLLSIFSISKQNNYCELIIQSRIPWHTLKLVQAFVRYPWRAALPPFTSSVCQTRVSRFNICAVWG